LILVGGVLVQRMASSSSQVSYDELMRQVQDLQRENTDLRRELLHSSSNIRQMESDTSALKESLVNVRSMTLNEVDTDAATAAYDDYMYASRLTQSTALYSSDLAFHDHAYSLSGSKFYY